MNVPVIWHAGKVKMLGLVDPSQSCVHVKMREGVKGIRLVELDDETAVSVQVKTPEGIKALAEPGCKIKFLEPSGEFVLKIPLSYCYDISKKFYIDPYWFWRRMPSIVRFTLENKEELHKWFHSHFNPGFFDLLFDSTELDGQTRFASLYIRVHGESEDQIASYFDLDVFPALERCGLDRIEEKPAEYRILFKIRMEMNGEKREWSEPFSFLFVIEPRVALPKPTWVTEDYSLREVGYGPSGFLFDIAPYINTGGGSIRDIAATEFKVYNANLSKIQSFGHVWKKDIQSRPISVWFPSGTMPAGDSIVNVQARTKRLHGGLVYSEWSDILHVRVYNGAF